MTPDTERLTLTETSLRAFFHQSLHDAARNQRLDADDASLWYLTQLLSDFSRADRLFDQHEHGLILTPLAELYRQALEAGSPSEKRLLLRKLGDVALFICGLYSGLFTRRRRLVDVDYYMAMGGSAYACLSSDEDGRQPSLADLFATLSARFVHFVDLIAEVGEQAFSNRDQDLLRMHSVWEKTGSPRLHGKLIEAGICPASQGRGQG